MSLLIIITLIGFAMLLFTLVTSGKIIDMLVATLYGCVATLIHNQYGNSSNVNMVILSLGLFALAVLSFSFWHQYKAKTKMVDGLPFPLVVSVLYLLVLATMFSYWFR